MNILIVGGGKIGRNLARFLADEDHTVTLVEQRDDLALRLTRDLANVRVIEGDGCSPAVLREARIDLVDAVAALTGDDEDNLVVALLAKREFRVRRVAARINNPKNAWMFTARMGVDVPVDATRQIARGLEADIGMGVPVSLLRLREGSTTLVELTVAPESGSIGKPIHALGLPPECVLVALLRGEAVIIPSGETIIQPNDQVLAVSRLEYASALAERFS